MSHVTRIRLGVLVAGTAGLFLLTGLQAEDKPKPLGEKYALLIGVRQYGVEAAINFNYNFFLTAQFLRTNWGATIIDGFEGMEGNGPASGTPVPSRIAIASTDYLAADRVGVECMGVDPEWIGWLKYSTQVGLGQGDLSKIDIKGVQIADVKKTYRLHGDIEIEKQWMGPMRDLPPNLGWMRPIGSHPEEAWG